MVLGQLSTDISVLRARRAGDRHSRCQHQGMGYPLSFDASAVLVGHAFLPRPWCGPQLKHKRKRER